MKNTNDLSFDALIPSSKSNFERNTFQYFITMNCTCTYTSMDQFPDPIVKLQILQSSCRSYNQDTDPKIKLHDLSDRKESSTR